MSSSVMRLPSSWLFPRQLYERARRGLGEFRGGVVGRVFGSGSESARPRRREGEPDRSWGRRRRERRRWSLTFVGVLAPASTCSGGYDGPLHFFPQRLHSLAYSGMAAPDTACRFASASTTACRAIFLQGWFRPRHARLACSRLALSTVRCTLLKATGCFQLAPLVQHREPAVIARAERHRRVPQPDTPSLAPGSRRCCPGT